MPRRPEPFLTIPEVAGTLNVNTRTVRRWIDAGYLPVHRLGGSVRISDADFRAFLAQRRCSNDV
ncbi:helix-turn-helix domain-containing protein [Anderseniella sp. Alg231-50]|uniref:helix-turn-helix domain-containing protein n=1 Tax=Anderseniella sp. Alg231-50 TaxID=1922226 RepID=UPI000D54D1A8